MQTATKPVFPIIRDQSPAPVTLVRKTSSQMVCPACGSHNVAVTDSRITTGNTIRRRRACLSCNHRLTTYEVEAAFFDQVRVVDHALQSLREVERSVARSIEYLQTISRARNDVDDV